MTVRVHARTAPSCPTPPRRAPPALFRTDFAASTQHSGIGYYVPTMRTLTAALFLLAACVHQKAEAPKSGVYMASQFKAKDGTVTGAGGVGAKGKVRCHIETPARSHIHENGCRYEDDTADSVNARRAATEAMQKPNTVQPIR